MPRKRLRLAVVALSVLLAATSSVAAEPRRSAIAPVVKPQVGLPALFAKAWAALAHRWQKSGPGLDPYGQCGSCQDNGPGPSLDPFGQFPVGSGSESGSGSGS